LITENLSTLKIYKLTQEQYERRLANGEIDQTALYFTDEEDADVFATIEQLEGKADKEHTHNDIYYTKSEIDDEISTINESISNLDLSTTIDNKINLHNSSDSAHNDIRNLINELSVKLNAFLDVDDATTDQLSEVLALIEQNKDVIESFTGKVNVSDIVDNLTTADASKVLSANQGVVIQSLVNEVANSKADALHSHDDTYYTESEVDEKINVINASVTDAKSYADGVGATTLDAAKAHADNAVSQKTQVQIITWGADD
jgi:hypothetical protein